MVMVQVKYYGVIDDFCIQRETTSFILATRDPRRGRHILVPHHPRHPATLPTLKREGGGGAVKSQGGEGGFPEKGSQEQREGGRKGGREKGSEVER